MRERRETEMFSLCMDSICDLCGVCSVLSRSRVRSAICLGFTFLKFRPSQGQARASRGCEMIQKNPADRRNAATRLAGQARMQRGVCSL